jgi:capsular polysaccharide export protein
MVGVCHWLHRAPGLEALLGQSVTYLPFRGHDLSELAVWGGHSSPARVARLAVRLRVPWFRVANGFLRPIRQGRNEAPLSVVVDDEGFYEDARTASRLERLAGASHCAAQRERARKLIELWRQGRVSEFNHAREEPECLPSNYVLVIDQPVKGTSIRSALAEPSSFDLMLDAALSENPDCAILVYGPSKRPGGYIDLAKARRCSRVQLLFGEFHPPALLERARSVYTVSSQLGFEALLWGKPVRTFGMPFYAGWGLTADTLPAPRRRFRVALEDLAHAALVEYSRYRNPETGQGCQVEEILNWLILQRRTRARFPVTLYACGFSPRKRRFVRDFLQGSTVHFVRNARRLPHDAPLVVWGSRQPSPAASAPSRSDPQRSVIRVEDGFLRSVGLGAALVRPLSWAFDCRGIHYDAAVPSELECLLQNMKCDPELLARARQLRHAIVTGGFTKYNVGSQPWKRPPGVDKVILAPGQVEGDASLRYGAPGIRTNLGLLRAVRAANPDAYLVYKPHPDVFAGLRAQGKGEEETLAWCDEQVPGAPMGQLLLDVDEVHVLTSLAGFEALLRGKSVTCYGQPFYAGWGLTRDLMSVPRRTRELSLDEMLAIALIVYPTYISRSTGQFTTPERVLEELRQWHLQSSRRRSGPIRSLTQRLFHAFLQRMEVRP